jgi:Co/Zn/Cd efflux system component
MYVDVVTYLFNFLAERFKHKAHSSNMKPRSARLYRLQLELIPPFISVVTLVAVTVFALRDALTTITEPPVDQENQPDLSIMFIFSGLNLILDFVNVSCFAKVDQAVGLSSSRVWDDSYANESSALLHRTNGETGVDDDDKSEAASQDTETGGGLNLNMCSAWTHICADTLRSIAVLIAAGFAFLFPHLLTAADADAWAAIIVSVVILLSLLPLLNGLFQTGHKICHTYGLDDQLHHHTGVPATVNIAAS